MTILESRMYRWVGPAGWLAVAGVAAAQVWLAARARPVLADLGVYLGAVDQLTAHGVLYDYRAANGDPFTYPPFAGLVMAPLSWIGERTAQVCWTLATLLVVCMVAQLISLRLPVRLTGRVPAGLAAPGIALILLASAPVSSNLRLGQISLFLFAAVIVDCLVELPRPLQGVLIGLAAAIKLTPIAFIALLWLAGRRRAAVTATVTFALATAGTWLVIPGQSHRFWATELWNTSRIGDLAQGGNQSVNGMLLRWGMSDPGKQALWAGIVLVVVALALPRVRRALRAEQPLLAVAIMGAATVAVSPVSWNHHQTFLLLAAAGVLATSGRQWWWTAGVLAVMIAPVGGLTAALIPATAPVAENLRALLAVAVACAVPFTATRRPRPAPVTPTPQADRRSGSPAGKIALFALVSLVTVTGCATGDTAGQQGPAIERVATIDHGTTDGADWRVELVRQDGHLCTAATVRGKTVGLACPPASASDRPLNFAVDGDKTLIVIHGLISPQVAALEATNTGEAGPRALQPHTLDADPTHRYFGYAVPLGAAKDLIARDAGGTVLMTSAAKLAESQTLATTPPLPEPTESTHR